jgi:heme exporter protein A
MGLRGREQLPLRVLSQGQKRRSSLARMLTTRARLWILDEPFVALDSHAQTVVCDVIADHVKAGGMALLTSHQVVQIGLPGRSYRLAS